MTAGPLGFIHGNCQAFELAPQYHILRPSNAICSAWFLKKRKEFWGAGALAQPAGSLSCTQPTEVQPLAAHGPLPLPTSQLTRGDSGAQSQEEALRVARNQRKGV